MKRKSKKSSKYKKESDTMNEQERMQIAQAAASAMHRRYKWASLSDLQQEAALAIEVARRTFDPKRGEASHYFTTAARRACWEWVARYGHAASASKNYYRDKLFLRSVASDKSVERVVEDTPEDIVGNAEWQARTHAVLDKLVAEIEHGAEVLDSMTGPHTLRQVAAEVSLTESRIKAIAREVRERIRESRAARDLMKAQAA